MGLQSQPLPPGVLLTPLLLSPILAFRRPGSTSLPLFVVLMAGLLSGQAAVRESQRDCRHRLPESGTLTATGWIQARPVDGRSEFLLRTVLEERCGGSVPVTFRRGVEVPPVGTLVEVEGQWRRFAPPEALHPGRGGRLAVGGLSSLPTGENRAMARFRGKIQERTERLFPQGAGVVDALVLARREGLSTEVRETLARAGISHLMAISGFHVGVVAGFLLLLARSLGAGPRVAPFWAAVGVVGYTLLIGAPPAALRASLLVSALALTRMRAIPAAPLAGVAAPFLLMLAWDPLAILSIGFQLSFAGATGLVVFTRPLAEWIRGPAGGRGARKELVSRARTLLSTPLAAGLAATVATLPLAIWHFHRLPVMGIPATLVLTPLVATVIPSIGLVLLVDLLIPGLAGFLGGGVEVILAMFLSGAHVFGMWDGAYPWVTRSALVLALAGLVLGEGARRLTRDLWHRRVHGGPHWEPQGAAPGSRSPTVTRRPWVQRRPLWWSSGSALLLLGGLWLPLPGEPAVEIVMVDVGQGDGVLVRSPRGRWIMVDAGPRSPTFDAGTRRMIPALRTRGGRRLDLLVLSHPHLDHFGGADALVTTGSVSAVMDPGFPVPSHEYLSLLRAAVDQGVGWVEARAGARWEWDGVEWEVLYPVHLPSETISDPNEVSAVLRLRYGDFTVLFTGDATHRVEEELLRFGGLGPVTVLKVAHHGSRTSSTAGFLAGVRPQVALVSLGRENRFGHPAPEVMARFERMGVPVFRTDEHGTLRILGFRDGTFRLEPQR
ncbi:MAG: ComEC/Rec2 family competence protein [Gemmatimonadota bacterium]